MFLLRRAAVRSLSAQSSIVSQHRSLVTRTSRQLKTAPQWQPLSFQRRFIGNESTSDEPAKTEPSAEEQKDSIVEESIATPDVADAEGSTSQAKSTMESIKDKITEAAQSATQAASETLHTGATRAAELTEERAPLISKVARDFAPRTSQDNPPRPSRYERTANYEKPAPSRILYVGNLFFEATAEQLEQEFKQFGVVVSCKMVTDSSGATKGFGYVEYDNVDSATRAIQHLDQEVFQGRRMAVQYHVRREPRERDGAAYRDSNPPSKTLFVGNMSFQMSDKDLNELFREVRNVLDVRVAIDRRSGQPRGFAHADFIDVESAEKAKKVLENKSVYGRTLRVDFSRPTTTRQGLE